MPEYYTQDFNDLRLPGMPDPVEVDKCIPRFHTKERLVSHEGGREEITYQEWVEIITPGDRLSRPIQKVTDAHRQRWPRQYAAFKSGLDVNDGGTPIATWADIGWQMQIDLRGMGFNTLEQLASAHDGQMSSVPNGTLLRKKARDWLDRNKKVETQVSEIDDLKRQLAEVKALIGNGNVLSQPAPNHGGDHSPAEGRATASDAPRRRPGRPRKAAGVAGVSGQAPPQTAAV